MRALTDAQAALAGEVTAFLAAQPPAPHVTSLDERFAFLVGFQQRLHAAGLAVVSWPERHGGRDLGAAEAALVAGILARNGAPEVVNFVALDVISPALRHFGDDARVDAWLPPMASADEVWCQMFSEPDAGSDLGSLRTAARRTDGGWLVNGEKLWCTWGQYARWGLLLARTGQAEERHRGITAFVADMRLHGIATQPIRTMTGVSEFASVTFTDALLPHDAVLGDVGGGWDVAMHMLAHERGPYALRRGTIIRRGFEQALQRARSVAQSQQSEASLVDAAIALAALEAKLDTVVTQLDRGELPGVESTLTKVLLSEADQAVFSAAHATLGTRRAIWEDDEAEDTVESYLYSRAATIYGGAREIQYNIIAERLLGLPRQR